MDAGNYEQFCADKLAALERHIARRPEHAGEREEAIAGIYCWAAEAVLGLEGPSERCLEMLERAASAAPKYKGLDYMRARLTEASAVSTQPTVVPHDV